MDSACHAQYMCVYTCMYVYVYVYSVSVIVLYGILHMPFFHVLSDEFLGKIFGYLEATAAPSFFFQKSANSYTHTHTHTHTGDASRQRKGHSRHHGIQSRACQASKPQQTPPAHEPHFRSGRLQAVYCLYGEISVCVQYIVYTVRSACALSILFIR